MQSKEKYRTSTPSLSKMNPVLGFPIDAVPEGQYESVDGAAIDSERVSISTISISVIPEIAQIVGMRWKRRPLGSSMDCSSGSTGEPRTNERFRRYGKSWDLIDHCCAVLSISLHMRQRISCLVVYTKPVDDNDF